MVVKVLRFVEKLNCVQDVQSEETAPAKPEKSAKQQMRDDRKAWKKTKLQKKAAKPAKKAKNYTKSEIQPIVAKVISIVVQYSLFITFVKIVPF